MVSSQLWNLEESMHLTGVSMYVDPLNPPDAVCMMPDVSRALLAVKGPACKLEETISIRPILHAAFLLSSLPTHSRRQGHISKSRRWSHLYGPRRQLLRVL